MSFFVNFLVRTSVQQNARFLNPSRLLHATQVNCLYAPSALGIDGFLQARKKVKDQFTTYSDKFRSKMEEFVSTEKNMIFTEDLKNMVHLAEPTDLDLVLKMIKKFNSQNTEYRFGSFVFGPVVMRMFHFLDAPQQALKCFEDESNSGFFDQLVSYHILLDLLYNNEMYEEMYTVFKKVQDKQINMSKYPKYPVVLILAACYKQNTPKSMEYASKLWSDMTSVGTTPLRRSATFFAALALKQGAPHVALEVISGLKQHYVTIRNIKAVSLAQGGRVEEALPLLRSVLQIDAPDQHDKHTFFEETIMKVKAEVEQSNDNNIKMEFESIEKALRDRNLINDLTLDQLLNAEIKPNRQSFDQRGGQFNQKRRMPFGQRQRNTY